MHHIREVPGHRRIGFTRRQQARISPDSRSENVLRMLEGRTLRLG